MSSHDDWNAVTERIKKDFPSYIPVPSIGDANDYKILDFLLLKEQDPNQLSLRQSVTNLFVAQQPPFFPIGRDVFKSKSKKKAGTVPAKIHSEKIVNFDESENKSSSKATATVNKLNGELGGVVEQQSASPPLSLGTITQLRVDYRELNARLKKLKFDSETIKEAEKGSLLLIHEVIMAEKLAFAGEEEKTEYSGKITTPAGGIGGNYAWSRSTSNLSRPEDYGSFPIGYKVCKLRACQVNPGRNTGQGKSSSYFLKLEQRRYFAMPYTERNFYETNESENEEETSKTCHKLSCFK